MLIKHNPARVAPPFSNYAHGVEVPADARWVYVSGQVGVRPDGATAEGPQAQMEQAFANIFAVLDAAGMDRSDLVKVTSLLTRREDIPIMREVRERLLGDALPASTLMIVAGLAQEDWLVEIEAVAAR